MKRKGEKENKEKKNTKSGCFRKGESMKFSTVSFGLGLKVQVDKNYCKKERRRRKKEK